ncbi:MAG: OsmC family protein [Candidatus Nanohaloarchaea archaeon]
MVDYPLEFFSATEASKGEDSWEAGISDQSLDVSVPEEFGGVDSLATPEDLFLSSIENCIVATFKTIAERKNLEFETIESSSRAVLDRGKDSRPIVDKAEVDVVLKGIADEEKAEEVREAAMKNCFIHRSVKTEIEESFSWE